MWFCHRSFLKFAFLISLPVILRANYSVYYYPTQRLNNCCLEYPIGLLIKNGVCWSTMGRGFVEIVEIGLPTKKLATEENK